MNKEYELKIEKDVLRGLKADGIDEQDSAQFFVSQVEAMLDAPHNFNLYGAKMPISIMRGYFPDTTFFFKVVLIKKANMTHKAFKFSANGGIMGLSAPVDDGGYFAKVSIPRTASTRKNANSVYIQSNVVRARNTQVAENELLGAQHEIKPLLEETIKRPKCMSPKGIKVYKLKRRKKECAKPSA